MGEVSKVSLDITVAVTVLSPQFVVARRSTAYGDLVRICSLLQRRFLRLVPIQVLNEAHYKTRFAVGVSHATTQLLNLNIISHER